MRVDQEGQTRPRNYLGRARVRERDYVEEETLFVRGAQFCQRRVEDGTDHQQAGQMSGTLDAKAIFE